MHWVPRSIVFVSLVLSVSIGCNQISMGGHGMDRYAHGGTAKGSPDEVTKSGKDGAPMVRVPAGEFKLGHGRSVYLDSFYIDLYEVTTSRYAAFLEATGRPTPFRWSEVNLPKHGNRPVVGVDWYDADAYCGWAGKRLPAEAEWEKAARGTDGRIYPWGNEEPTSMHANFNHCCERTGYDSLSSVGSYEAGRSPYGVYDMAGNVWEWVADWYDKNFYQDSRYHNPIGPESGVMKVLRGGGFDDGPLFLKTTFRLSMDPPHRHLNYGFRCAW